MRPDLKLMTNIEVPRMFHDRLRFAQVGWLLRPEYDVLMRGSVLNLHCTWAETFGYQPAEAALMGIPSVTSATIPWAHADQMATPNDPEGIAQIARHLMSKTSEEVRDRMVSWARQANAILRQRLESL